jgi:CcmD family protein
MLATVANAQTEMADTMRSNGKIYVVVTVLATIFAAIFAYLVMLDRKITKLEKNKSKN